MYITHLIAKNFRALEDINCELTPRINVIVGPNAIGKTTILQAIRLPKALLAPRTQNEATQTLISLGAASPHFPQRILLEALARDAQKPIEIRTTYRLDDREIETLGNALPETVRALIQNRLGQGFANPTVLIQFLGSPAGQRAQVDTTQEVQQAYEKLKRDKTVVLGIRISSQLGGIQPHDPIASIFVSFLDQTLPPQLTLFSYFPADRALPVGEIPVQFGGPDTVQQLEAHNSQPQLKYNRLKNTIFGTIVRGETERQALSAEFQRIFSGVLPGRRVVGPGINEIGLLSIMVEEIDTKRQFEMDNLSSGEKGLILTFLLIAQTLAKGGIVLLDEPELHLNPAVCKEILSFLFEKYAVPNDLQFIICSHSPEILSSAFDRDEYALYHLVSEQMITRVGRRALDELSDALQKLGTSVSEGLLYKGTVLVEGDDDVRLLEEGFGDVLRRFKITDRGGRREIEKTIMRLQELEKKGEKVDPIFLIFDRDDKPSTLQSSSAVKVLQWKRYCLENYLIDIDVLTELLKLPEISATPISRAGEVEKLLRDLAFAQLDEIAARKVYLGLGYLSPGLHADDVERKSLSEIAKSLFVRRETARASLTSISESDWSAGFLTRCKTEREALELIWETSWKEQCNGKLLFSQLQSAHQLKVPLPAFKRRIMQHMKVSGSENWRLIASLLKELIGDP